MDIPVFFADRVIQGRINQTFELRTSDWILTDIEVWGVWGSVTGFGIPVDVPNGSILAANMFPDPNDPDGISQWNFNAYNDHLTFYTTQSPPGTFSGDAEPCLGPDAMSYLTQSAYSLMSIVQNTYLPNSTVEPVLCRIQGDRLQYGGTLSAIQYRYMHNIDFVYGRWQYTGPR